MRTPLWTSQRAITAQDRQLIPGLLAKPAESIAQHNTVNCNATISDCDLGRELQLILGLLAAMAKIIIQQNTIYCNATVSNGDTGHEWHLISGHLAMLVESVARQNTIACENAISDYYKESQMAADHGPPDQGEHRAAEHRHLQRHDQRWRLDREWQLILGLLTNMPESVMQRNIVTCNATISVCAMGVEWHLIRGLLAGCREHCAAEHQLRSHDQHLCKQVLNGN